MALTYTPQSGLLTRIVQETVSNATAQDNITGSSGTWYNLDVDNSASSADVYVKLYNNNAPIVGVTEPDWVFKVVASTRLVISSPQGFAFSNGLSLASVTTPGKGGVVNPVSPPVIRIIAS